MRERPRLDSRSDEWPVLGVMLEILLFPMHILMRCVEEVSGEGRWYRQQRCRMESERPPLPDAEYLRAVAAGPEEGPLWLVVRCVVADSIGLPATAVYPQDKLADLWRMQWLGPDILDLVFRLERLLTIKIPRGTIEKFTGRLRYGQDGEFREFAQAVVRGLREVMQSAGQDRRTP